MMDENKQKEDGLLKTVPELAHGGEGVSNESTTETLPHLKPPSSDEAEAYYHGLPSMPRLVGRTSAGIVSWPPPPLPPVLNYTASPTKSLARVGRHRILECWESTVREKVLHAIGSLDWTSVDVVRIGYDNVPVEERPVVVWVGVTNKAHPWNPDVCKALRECRRILDQAGLSDVECEIRVSDFRRFA